MKIHAIALALLAVNALPAMAEVPPAANVNADNTAINKRDAGNNTLTPADQSRGSQRDVDLTRSIRQMVTNDKSLSAKAHNVKIITINGIATLRGPVENAAERTKVAQLAANVVGGAKYVRNQIEVKAP
jgi:hyperosmotically inducible protein